MKVFSLSKETGASVKEVTMMELPDEAFAVATNGVDLVAFGGKDKKAYLQSAKYTEGSD